MVAVGGLVVRDGAVLTVRVSSATSDGLLRLPGGIAATTEGLESSVIRHVADETGIECYPQRIAGFRYAVRECRCAEKDEMYIVFAARYIKGEPTPDGKGIVEAQFLPIEDLLERNDVVELTAEMIRSWQENSGLIRSEKTFSSVRPWNIYECYTLGGSRKFRDDEVREIKNPEKEAFQVAHHSRL